jgi:excisionase family DNA binding protein
VPAGWGVPSTVEALQRREAIAVGLARHYGAIEREVTCMHHNDRLLTSAEVADLYRVDPKTVMRWAAAGRIPSVLTPGGHRRFRASVIRALLADLEKPQVPAPRRAVE